MEVKHIAMYTGAHSEWIAVGPFDTDIEVFAYLDKQVREGLREKDVVGVFELRPKEG